MEHRLQMEALVLKIADRFLALEVDDSVDTAIDETLAEVGMFARVGLCHLFQMDPGGATASMTHLWARDASLMERPLRNVDLSEVTPWVESLRSGEAQVMGDTRTAGLPAPLLDRFERFGIRANLTYPLFDRGTLVAWLGLSAVGAPRAWREEERTLVQFVAQTFAHALHRHRDQAALRHSEARFQAFLEQNPDAMYVLELSPPLSVDRPVDEQAEAILDARIVLCNQPSRVYFGRSNQEIIGRTFGDVFTGASAGIRDRLKRDVRQFIENGYQIRIDETFWVTPDGRESWVARSAHGVVADGRLMSIWASARDISEQKRARDERELMAKRLQQSERLESVGLLAGGIAHDFNNLLLAILGNTDLAQLHLEDPERVRESLGEIRRAGQRAAELTRQLLAFSRRQPTVKRPTNLNDLVASASRMLKRLLPETIELDFVPGHDLGMVMADEAQIEQLLLNLSINARDAMPSGGRLTMETQNVRLNGEYCRTHPWAKPGRYVLLAVSDTGHGIDEDGLERIFEPFYTTKAPGAGTGLGLSTVYGIVQQHGGMIQVYSELGVGTTFKIYLPITELEARRVGPEVRPAPPRGDETVLLAEDEQQVRTVAKRILERAGYTVVAVSTGVEAVETFAAEPDRFDAVVLDVVMPAMNGRQAHARIQQLRPGVPILFSSGYTGTVLDGVELDELDAPLLPKPYDPDALLVALRRAIDAARSR